MKAVRALLALPSGLVLAVALGWASATELSVVPAGKA